jgi:hypothetical protein
MRRWSPAGRSLRAAALAGLLVLLLLVAAKIHACACTGGPPEWRPVYPTSQETGDR